jgi:hypothetical protein
MGLLIWSPLVTLGALLVIAGMKQKPRKLIHSWPGLTKTAKNIKQEDTLNRTNVVKVDGFYLMSLGSVLGIVTSVILELLEYHRIWGMAGYYGMVFLSVPAIIFLTNTIFSFCIKAYVSKD